MSECLADYLQLPEACHLGKRVFKKLFHEHAPLKAADARALRDDVDTIVWQHTLKPTTIAIPAFQDDEREYLEIAVLEGTTTEDVMRKVIDINEFDIDLELIDSHEEGMELLNAGRVDGYASDRAMLIGQVFLNVDAGNEYSMTRSALSFEPYAFMVPKGDSDFRLVADKALAAQFRGAGIRRLYQNWFGRYGEPLSPIVAAMYEFQAVGQ